jgi:hypothetical protein
MSLRPEPLPPIPDATAAAVRAAFPKGNLYVDLRAEFGTLYHDQLFADLYPPEGHCQLNRTPLYSLSSAWHTHPMNALPRARKELSSYQ